MSIRNTAVSIAMVGSLLAGCGGEGHAPDPEQGIAECDPQTAALMGSFAIDTFDESDTEAESLSSMQIERFLAENPNLRPQELIDAYVAERTDLMEGFNLVFDEGIVPEDWEEDPDLGEVIYLDQRLSLIGRVDSLMRVFGEYPTDILRLLGVDTTRIANIYDGFDGHFDRDASEILIELDAFGAGETSVPRLREIIAHELFGHAAHAIFCLGNFHNDPEFSQLNNDFEYLGMPQEGETEEETQARYDQIPPELLEYGPERMFVVPYGASNVAEDFATIAEFTLEKRGVIQSDDADYGSPLQQKQELLLERLDQLLPGFRDVANQRTEILRRNPANEIYSQDIRTINMPAEVIPWAENFNKSSFDQAGQVAVLNGTYYVPPTGKERVGELLAYPALSIGPNGYITAVHTPQGTETVYASQDLSQQVAYFEGELEGGDILVMPVANFEQISATVPLPSPEADEFFATDLSVVSVPFQQHLA